MRGHFVHELGALINKYSLENESDTPDFILASFLNDCLNAFNTATRRRDDWYGRKKDEDVGEVCE